LQAPAGLATRPTSDRLRETLFNVLAPRIEGAAFLDLYAGSGAVGMEALSRGAASVTFVERAPAALAVLRGNLEKLGLTTGFQIFSGSVSGFLRKATSDFEIIFLDPPYDAAQEYAATLGLLGGAAARLLAADGLVIAEHRRKEKLEESYGSLRRMRLLEQGDAGLSFYQISAGDEGASPAERLDSSNARSAASSSTGILSSSAFSSLEPASSPATT
jgi:16S rRNA (guanine(966)-N(2))-methyltransferase RsmD